MLLKRKEEKTIIHYGATEDTERKGGRGFRRATRIANRRTNTEPILSPRTAERMGTQIRRSYGRWKAKTVPQAFAAYTTPLTTIGEDQRKQPVG